jgi:hypothetical protein
MPVMAKKKPERAGDAGADRHKNAVVSFRPEPALRAALRAVAARQRRSVAQVVVLLLEKALEADGEWPPAVGGADA